MQPALVLGAAVIGVLTAQAVPATQPMLAAVRGYIADYQAAFGHLVADEVTVQTVIQWRDLLAERTTRGEFYTVFANADRAWMTVHDVAVVDGKPVANRPNVLDLLASTGQSAPAIRAHNARYNIGGARRNLNEPTLVLQLLADWHDDMSFDRPRAASAEAGRGLVQVDFRLKNDSRFITSTYGRVRTSGSILAEPGSGRIRHTSIALDTGAVTATLETEYAHNERLGLWVPVTFLETYRQPTIGETTTVRSEYTNYRRFETGGRLRSVGDPAQP
jgi:hypothetical protein